MTRWGWIGLASGTVAAAGVGVAFSGVWPSYSAVFGLFPTTAAGFKGHAALMQAYLAKYRPQSGVATAQNALAWQLYDDLLGTEFGYTVAGLQHTVTNGIVTNTVLAIPAGATVVYQTLGANPYNPAESLIGKYVTVSGQAPVLWQVYSTSTPN